MKKLVLFLAAVLLTAIGANVFAQGTGINPEVGSVHTYSVNGVGTSYTWTVTTQADLGGTNLLTAGTVVSGSSSSNSIDLTWLNPDVANDAIYYVHVEVEDSEGCKNNKVMAVQPVNNFALNIWNVLSDGSMFTDGDSINYSVCAPDITTISWNGADPVTSSNATDFDYNYGSLEFYYKVSASGLNIETTEWTPEFSITQVAGTNATVTVDSIVGDLGTGTWQTTSWPLDGTAITPTVPEGTGNDVLWIRITVANNTDNENLSDNDFTIALTSNSADENGNSATDLGNTQTVQTQSVRPDTGGITTD